MTASASMEHSASSGTEIEAACLTLEGPTVNPTVG
jgi:hypothetical protein